MAGSAASEPLPAPARESWSLSPCAATCRTSRDGSPSAPCAPAGPWCCAAGAWPCPWWCPTRMCPCCSACRLPAAPRRGACAPWPCAWLCTSPAGGACARAPDASGGASDVVRSAALAAAPVFVALLPVTVATEPATEDAASMSPTLSSAAARSCASHLSRSLHAAQIASATPALHVALRLQSGRPPAGAHGVVHSVCAHSVQSASRRYVWPRV